jgi:uncharacterized protein YukE
MISEEDRIAKVLADRINERFRAVIGGLKEKMELIDRRVSRLESESVENLERIIEAVFTATIKAETRRVSSEMLRDFREELESLKSAVASLQNQISKLAVVVEGFRIDEERYKAHVEAFNAEINKLNRTLEGMMATLDRKADEFASAFRAKIEKIADDVFRIDTISLEKMLRTVVTGVVSERFEKLGEELLEKLRMADDLSVRLEELAKMVRDLQKNMDELMKGAGGVRMEMGVEEKKGLKEEDLMVE